MEEHNLNPHPPTEPENPEETKIASKPETPETPEAPEIPEIPSFSQTVQTTQYTPPPPSPPPPSFTQTYYPPPYYNQNYPPNYQQNYPQNYYPNTMYYQVPPYMPNYTAPPPPEKPAPAPPPAQPLPMNKKILTTCWVIASMIFLLCMYCMVSDIMHGALNGDVTNSPTVVLQTQEKPDLDPEDENVTADKEYTAHGVAELVKPSIVQVVVYDENSNLNGKGSGIIISEDGYIVTNAHVVQGSDFTVILDDQTEYTAQLIGSDAKTDLAVLKVNATDLTPAVLGNSDETYVGETVLAIGNPAGLSNSVTRGIVSAVNRQIRAQSSSFRMECIQTDAAISPGNSGGALVNMYGQIIGITSSKYASQYEATYEGLGFAITMKQALPIIEDLIENGYVSGRFRIGIVFMPTNRPEAVQEFQKTFNSDVPNELKNCIWITEVSEDCDISNTDLRANDFIISVNGKKVSDYDTVLSALDGFQGGDTVSARCARYEKGKVTYYEITFKLEEDTSGNY